MSIEFTQTGGAWFFVSRGSTFHLGKITKSHEYGPLFNGMTTEEMGAILAKMKELQSPNKDIEFLQADLSALETLLESATARDDHVNGVQLSSRIAQRKRELEELQSEVEK